MSKDFKLILALVLSSVLFSVVGIIIDSEVKSLILLFLFYGMVVALIQHVVGTLLVNNRNKFLYLIPVIVNIVLIIYLIYSFHNAGGIMGGLAEYILIYTFISAAMYNSIVFFFLVKE